MSNSSPDSHVADTSWRYQTSLYSVGVRVFLFGLLASGAIFFSAMAVLASHDSSIRCTGRSQCTHVETYPFGMERKEDLAEIVGADTQWSPGGRTMAIKLVLTHVGGVTTEYQGVGRNGVRAQKVAAALNQFIQQPQGAGTFSLREGSMVASAFLVFLTACSLLLISSIASKLIIERREGAVVMTVQRWPRPPRVHQFARAGLMGFVLRPIVSAGMQTFRVDLVHNDGSGADVGMAFGNAQAAEVRVAELNAWLALQRTARWPLCLNEQPVAATSPETEWRQPGVTAPRPLQPVAWPATQRPPVEPQTPRHPEPSPLQSPAHSRPCQCPE